jgi:hypothetical protein
MTELEKGRSSGEKEGWYSLDNMVKYTYNYMYDI